MSAGPRSVYLTMRCPECGSEQSGGSITEFDTEDAEDAERSARLETVTQLCADCDQTENEVWPVTIRCGGCGQLSYVVRPNEVGSSYIAADVYAPCSCRLTYGPGDVEAALDRWRRTGKRQQVRARSPIPE